MFESAPSDKHLFEIWLKSYVNQSIKKATSFKEFFGIL